MGTTGVRRLVSLLPPLALVLAIAAVLAPAAAAKTYTDVPARHWAHDIIDWVTDQGPAGDKLLNDYGGGLFDPEQAITRAELARAVVVACGHQDDVVDPPIAVADVPKADPYYHDIQVALSLGLMTQFKSGFHPAASALSWQADRAVVRMLKVMNPTADWTILMALNPNVWQPNDKWKTGAPRYLASEVAARSIGLRINHPTTDDTEETSPGQPIDRAEVASILYQALHASAWRIGGLASFDEVTFPPLTDRQKQIVRFALKYVGYPYIWAGEYPTPASPYGAQAHGGFDCSGFVWWVLKIHFGYSIKQRVAADMAAAARPRIARADLVPGDMIFFGPKGPRSAAASIYHAAMYLGNGWFIHSTGSSGGVSLASITWDGWSWKTDFAWGRRVLKPGEFTAAAADVAAAAGDLAAQTASAGVVPAPPASSSTEPAPTQP